MSFGFSFIGELSEVQKAVTEYPYGKVNPQCDAARAYVLTEIGNLDVPRSTAAGPIIISVEASGHYDSSNSYVKVDVHRVLNFVRAAPLPALEVQPTAI